MKQPADSRLHRHHPHHHPHPHAAALGGGQISPSRSQVTPSEQEGLVPVRSGSASPRRESLHEGAVVPAGEAAPAATDYHQMVEEQQHQGYGGGKRGVHVWLLALTNVVGVIVGSIALGVPVYTKNTQLITVSTTFWTTKSCPVTQSFCSVYNIPLDSDCTDWRSRVHMMETFAVILLIALVNAAVWSVADVLQHCPKHFLPIVSSGVAAVFNLCTWAMVAGTYHTALCDSLRMSAAGYKMSSAFALLLSLWLWQMAILLFYGIRRYLESYKQKALDSYRQQRQP